MPKPKTAEQIEARRARDHEKYCERTSQQLELYKARQRRKYARDPAFRETMKLRARGWRLQNPEKDRATIREYKATHREEINARQRRAGQALAESPEERERRILLPSGPTAWRERMEAKR